MRLKFDFRVYLTWQWNGYSKGRRCCEEEAEGVHVCDVREIGILLVRSFLPVVLGRPALEVIERSGFSEAKE